MTDNTRGWVPDWAVDMARIPFDPNAERAAVNATTNGPRGMIPRDTTAPAPAAATPSSGWQNERPLGTQPGIDLIDRMCIAADRRERQQAMRPDSDRMMETMMQMMQLQSQTLQAVAAAILRNDKPKSKRTQAEAKKK
jgi:hypothetical protein